jgi:hypothetical protein
MYFNYNEIYYDVPARNIETLAMMIRNVQKVNHTLSLVKNARDIRLAAGLTTEGRMSTITWSTYILMNALY